MTAQLSLHADPPALEQAPPSTSQPSHERVLRMAAATMLLHGGAWGLPLAYVLVEARQLAERLRPRAASGIRGTDASDLRDVEAWIEDAERWLARGDR
jgi:hypothetical protein